MSIVINAHIYSGEGGQEDPDLVAYQLTYTTGTPGEQVVTDFLDCMTAEQVCDTIIEHGDRRTRRVNFDQHGAGFPCLAMDAATKLLVDLATAGGQVPLRFGLRRHEGTTRAPVFAFPLSDLSEEKSAS